MNIIPTPEMVSAVPKFFELNPSPPEVISDVLE
jgi:hypothetical protein